MKNSSKFFSRFALMPLFCVAIWPSVSMPVAAQSSSPIDECTSQDFPNGVQGTACLVGDSTYLNAYQESGLVGGWDYVVLGQGTEAKLYDGNTLVADSNWPNTLHSTCDFSYSNFQGSCSSTVIESVNAGDIYTLVGDIQELYDPSQTGNYSDAYWIDVGGDTVSAQVGP